MYISPGTLIGIFFSPILVACFIALLFRKKVMFFVKKNEGLFKKLSFLIPALGFCAIGFVCIFSTSYGSGDALFSHEGKFIRFISEDELNKTKWKWEFSDDIKEGDIHNFKQLKLITGTVFSEKDSNERQLIYKCYFGVEKTGEGHQGFFDLRKKIIRQKDNPSFEQRSFDKFYEFYLEYTVYTVLQRERGYVLNTFTNKNDSAQQEKFISFIKEYVDPLLKKIGVVVTSAEFEII